MVYICGESTSKLMLALDALLIDEEVDESLSSSIVTYAYHIFNLEKASEWSIDLFRKVMRSVEALESGPRMIMYLAEKVLCALEGDEESGRAVAEILGIGEPQPSRELLYYTLLALVNKAISSGEEVAVAPTAPQLAVEAQAP